MVPSDAPPDESGEFDMSCAERLHALIRCACFEGSQDERKDCMLRIMNLLTAPSIPDELRAAAMGTIERLARRRHAESPCQCGLDEMRRRIG